MTIILQFHLSGYRTFKDYCRKEVLVHQRGEFPDLVSYNRFVKLMPSVFVPLCGYLHTRFGECSGISVHLIAGLVAYTFREKNPSLHLRGRHLLPAVL